MSQQASSHKRSLSEAPLIAFDERPSVVENGSRPVIAEAVQRQRSSSVRVAPEE